MQKYVLLPSVYVSFVVFQVTSMESINLQPSLATLNKTLKNLEHSLSSSVQTSPKTSPLQDIGKQALVYTNEFRKQNGLLSLEWNQALADLATEHSKNMALGTVPFGHTDFDKRTARFPFRYRGAAENVFMTSSRDNIAKAAVDGWINSPGHRRNLLGKYTYCGIGAYKSPQNIWYLTQIFAV